MADSFQHSAFQYDAFQADYATLSDSVNINPGVSTNTTAQLSAPSGKSISDFSAGRISDDTNPIPAISYSGNKYTEVEFAVTLINVSVDDEIEFRIASLSQYEKVPKAIVGESGGASLTVQRSEDISVSEQIPISLLLPGVSIFDVSATSEAIYLSVGISAALYSQCSIIDYCSSSVSELPAKPSDNVSLTEYSAASILYLYGDTYSEVVTTEYVGAYVSAPSAEIDLEVNSYSQTELYDIAVGLVLLAPNTDDAIITGEYTGTYIEISLSTYSSIICGESTSANTGIDVSSEEHVYVADAADAVGSNLLPHNHEAIEASEQQSVVISLGNIAADDSIHLDEYCATVVSSLTIGIHSSIVTDEYTDAYLITDIVFSVSSYANLLDIAQLDVIIDAGTAETATLSDYASSLLYCHIYSYSDLLCSDAVSISAALFINTYYSAALQDYCDVVRDHAADVYDAVQVADYTVCIIQECICNVYSHANCDESAIVDVLSAAGVSINAYTTVAVDEGAECETSGLALWTSESISCDEYNSVFWIQATGLLIIDTDIVVPFADCDIVAPDIENAVDLPSGLCDLTAPETGVFIAIPDMLMEEV